MYFDALVVLQILIIAFPKWIMAVQCGRRHYHDQDGDDPFTATVKKPDGTWVECFAMLLLPHGRVFESDLLVTSSECIDAITGDTEHVVAFNRGHDEFAIRTPIYLEADGLRLLELKSAVTFTRLIRPICVPSGPSPIPRNGTTLLWTHGMNRVLEMEAVLVPDRECNSSGNYKPSRMLCVRAGYYDHVPTGTPYFTEVNGVNTLWGLYAFWEKYGDEYRYAFHRMVPIPALSVQNPGEEGYPHHYQYAPLEK